MEDTIKKTIVIVSFSKGIKAKNNPDYLFDICEYMTRKEGSDKEGNIFVSYSTKTSFGQFQLEDGVNASDLIFGAVCVGEFGEVYDRDKNINVLGLVGISEIVKKSPIVLEKCFPTKAAAVTDKNLKPVADAALPF